MAAAAVASQPPNDVSSLDAPTCSVDDHISPSKEFAVNDDIPTAAQLSKCAELSVFDKDGKELKFNELYAGPGKHLIIFIRHFFCGMCQDFVRALVASCGPSDLEALSPPPTVTLIGCGKPEMIPTYTKYTNCTFPIYVDPSRKLYEQMGLIATLVLGENRPAYQATGVGGVVVKSFTQALTAGSNMWKGGNYAQLGGEFLFEDGQVTSCHRMKNTRDHQEIADLRKLIGLEEQKA